MENRFYYGDKEITYLQLPRNTKTNRVLIKVSPDCTVFVHVPIIATQDEVKQAMLKKARWIFNQIEHFQSQVENNLNREFVSGESHYYLGRQYILKIFHQPKVTPSVKLLKGQIQVITNSPDKKNIIDLLDVWYRNRAKDVFENRLEAMLPKILWLKDKPPLRIFKMKTQWGSCSAKGQITLNPFLVKATQVCIDYVILHELCHIAEHNHSKHFYRLLSQVSPNWRVIKSKLDSMAIQFAI